MSTRETMLAAMRGEGAGFPWAPRMDLWYIARRERGTLPDSLAGMTMAELADELGIGCHAVRADYTLPRAADALALRGFGVDNHPDYPYEVVLRDLPVTCENDGQTATTTVETHAGTVRCTLRTTEQMRRDGISLPFVLEYPVRENGDLDAVAEIFRHLEVVPTPEAYSRFHERVGERGVAVANGSVCASPVHLLLHELMPMDRFFYLYHDEYAAMERFTEAVTPFFDRVLDAVLESSAEVVLWGANYDRDLTWPPFFEREIAPWLRRVGSRLREAGKLLLCHTDGENAGLLEHYAAAGIDVAESVCPRPMTTLDMAAVRAGIGADVALWGGVPSVMLLPEAVPEAVFEEFVDESLARRDRIAARGSRLIWGVSDNVPPDADLDRLARVGERLSG